MDWTQEGHSHSANLQIHGLTQSRRLSRALVSRERSCNSTNTQHNTHLDELLIPNKLEKYTKARLEKEQQACM